MAIARVPAILWGTSFANTLNFGYPLDNASAYGDPDPNAEWIEGEGFTDSWISYDEYILAGDVRWIPTSNTTDPVTATGWDTASTGWLAFLQWARSGNAFRFCPANTATGTYVLSYLVEPKRGEPPLEDDGTRKLRLVIRNNSAPYTGY